MIYREAGQFKTTYASDQAIFPILQDRVFVALVNLVGTEGGKTFSGGSIICGPKVSNAAETLSNPIVIVLFSRKSVPVNRTVSASGSS